MDERCARIVQLLHDGRFTEADSLLPELAPAELERLTAVANHVLEHVRLARTTKRLGERWIGKYVRTDRVLTAQEFPEWMGTSSGISWYPGFSWGGCAWVIGFVIRNGTVWIQSDEGLEWLIDDQTTITEDTPL